MAAAVEAGVQKGELGNREALRIMLRGVRDARPLWWRFGVRVGLTTINILPLFILPWPVKALLDHVVNGVPIGEELVAYPPYIQPWIDTLRGQSGEGMLLQIVLVFAVMLLLVGGHWRGRRSTSAGLAQGYDPATTAENDANRSGSASGGLFGWLEFKWELDLSQRLNHSIRSKTFDRIQRLPMRHFDDHQIGDAIFRVMYDTTAISELCFKLLGTPILAPLHILVASYILIVTYPSAPLIGQAALLSLPISLIVTIPFAGSIRRRVATMREAGATTTATIEEGMTNVLAVQGLGAGAREQRRFGLDSWDSFTEVRRWLLLVAIIAAIALVLVGGVFIWVFYEVTDLVIDERISPGDLGAILAFYGTLSGSASAIATLWITLQGNAAALNRVYQVQDLAGEPSADDAPPLPPIRQGFRLEGVSYRHADGTQALSGVDFEAEIGEVIGLVGPAGAGKTTLAYLIPRFIEPTSGRVLIDGRDASGFGRESLRSQVSFVFQETTLMDATIEENIRLANPNATDAEVRTAALTAGAHEFIESMPQGYQTRLGRDGGNLSIGQRQRLSIARALVRKSPILILDEPTSALDPETELQLVRALREASRDRLVLVIAHRLSTIRSADRIVFLDAGRVIEEGSHRELMERAGPYRRFVDLQTG